MITKYSLFLIFFLLIAPVMASDDVTWVTVKNNAKLYTGNTIAIGDYMVTAVDFSETEVILEITKDNRTVDSGAFSCGEWLVCDDDRLKLYVERVDPNYDVVNDVRVGWNPFAVIDFYLPGIPMITASITSGDSYESGKGKIHPEITLQNNGKAPAEDVEVEISFGADKSEYEYSSIGRTNKVIIDNVSFNVPSVDQTELYNLTVNVTYFDYRGDKHFTSAVKPINVVRNCNIVISKHVTPNCYIGEKVYCTVTVSNDGGYDVDDIRFVDYVPSDVQIDMDSFVADSTFDLRADERKTIKYAMKPLKVETYQIPSASISYTDQNGELHTINSTVNTVRVDGTDVTYLRNVIKNDDNSVNMSVTVTNCGNVGATVRVTDTLPDNAWLDDGCRCTKTKYLASGASYTMNYIFYYNLGDDVIINGDIKYTDLNRKTRTINMETWSLRRDTESVIENVYNPDDDPMLMYETPALPDVLRQDESIVVDAGAVPEETQSSWTDVLIFPVLIGVTYVLYRTMAR